MEIWRDRPLVLVLCPTATAANLVQGETFEAALQFFMQSNFEQEFLSAAREASLGYQLGQVKFLVIDEGSMVGSRRLYLTHSRFEQAKGRSNLGPFSGVPVVMSGDLRQLGPIMDRYFFKNTTMDGRLPIAMNIFQQNFKIYCLTEKMRANVDHRFATLCDNIGKGRCHCF